MEPLVLRANAGDCIQIKLTNRFGAQVPDHPGDSSLPPITDLTVDKLRPSTWVGLHPQLVNYNIVKYDGANVGYNKEQTADSGVNLVYLVCRDHFD